METIKRRLVGKLSLLLLSSIAFISVIPLNLMNSDIHSFIVRIWPEKTDNQGQVVAWRGSVEHVGKQEQRVYFSALEDLTTFIQNQSGIGPNRRLPPQVRLRLT